MYSSWKEIRCGILYLTLDSLYVRLEPARKLRFANTPSRQFHHRLRCILFPGKKLESIELQEQNTDHESGSLVSIDKGMVSNNPRCVDGSQIGQASAFLVRVILPRSRQRRLQQARIAYCWKAGVERYDAVMDRERVAFVDPDGLSRRSASSAALPHFARTFSVLR